MHAPDAGFALKTARPTEATRWPVRVALAAACVSIASGAATVLAWFVGAAAILVPTTASTPMRFNTALAFLLCGASLIASIKGRRRIAILCAAVVGLLGAATAAEYAFVVDLSIDEPLFVDHVLNGVRYDPRMAPNTAAAFTAAAGGLLLLGARGGRLRQALSLLVASCTSVLGVVAAVGYGAAVETAYTWGKVTGMSIVAAAGLLVLGLGMFAAIWARADEKGGVPSWLPLPIALLLASTTLLLWYALRHISGNTGVAVPGMVLGCGLAMTALTAIAVRLAQVTASKNRELQALSGALQQERERLHDVLNMLPAYVVLLSEDYHVPFANRYFEERFGKAEGRRCYEYLFQLSQPCENCQTYKVLTTNAPHQWEWTGPNGRDYAISDFPFSDSDGSPLIMEMGIDITERKRAEEKLRHLAAIVENSDDAIYSKRLDGTIVSWNCGAEKIYGYAAEEVIGHPVSRLAAPENHSEIQGILERIRCGETVEHYETVRLRKDGTRRNVSITVSPIRDSAGRITGASSIARDITDRKRAERQLQEQQFYTRSLIEASLDPLVTISHEGKITDANRATEAVTGMAREQLIGSDFCDYFTEPDKARAGYRQVFATGFVQDYPLAIRHSSGGMTEVLYNATVFRNRRGEVQGVFAAARDVTERKQAEERLCEQAALLELAPAGIFVRDLNSKIAYWSRGAEELYGWSREEATGKVTHDLLRTKFAAPVAAIESAVLGGVVWDGELVHTTRSGKELTVSSRWAPQKDKDGRPLGFLEINVDITARKRAEEELKRYAAELERSNAELQDFASIASHDLQEPLRKVLAFGEHLRGHLGENLDDLGKDFLARMQNAAHRMSALIEALLDYSRVTTRAQPFQPVDLTQVIFEVLADLEARIAQAPARVEFVPLPKVMADRTQLRQLFQNLVANALKFQKPGATPHVEIVGEVDDKGWCQITVRDDGIGFDEKYLDRIFRPFQRLHGRNEYEGSGMGLAICRKVVARHGGTITAHSRPGAGATFVVTLPAKTEAAETGEHERSEAWTTEMKMAAS